MPGLQLQLIKKGKQRERDASAPDSKIPFVQLTKT